MSSVSSPDSDPVPDGCNPEIWHQRFGRKYDEGAETEMKYTVETFHADTVEFTVKCKVAVPPDNPVCELCYDWATFYDDIVLKCSLGRADHEHNPEPRKANNVVVHNGGRYVLACTECADKGLSALPRTWHLEGTFLLTGVFEGDRRTPVLYAVYVTYNVVCLLARLRPRP